MTDVSVAEMVGMSFENRCAEAEVYLKKPWMMIQARASAELLHEQACARIRAQILEGLPSEMREEVLQVFELAGAAKPIREEHGDKLWKEFVQYASNMFGEDAAEHAKQAIRGQSN
jgi:hypothetical protein